MNTRRLFRALMVGLAVVAVSSFYGVPARAEKAASDPWTPGSGTCWWNGCMGSQNLCFAYQQSVTETVLCIRN